ncbi:MAG: tRNA pseudouridine(38-40) synthase TruA [Phycisphaerales bacterium]|nr:tRNA pseudouridine(38-40) synthase TruA [Phycisphaerales bacterium]
MTIAYDGTAYCGWQRQPDPVPTVQREVEKAAGAIVSHPVSVLGSSRTDTGVHARGQVGAMNVETHLDTERLRKAINSRLPNDILIRQMEEVDLGFDVRTAKRKRYQYCIWSDQDRPVFQRQWAYHYYRRLDIEAMQAACKLFEGEHDFEAFRGQADERENTVRTIFSCSIHRRAELVIFGVEGSGFLYHMVRTMVGTVLEVGNGRRKPECVCEIIASKDRRQAGPCAPAVGLCLQWIRF